MRFAEGVALRLTGRADEADAVLAHAVDVAKAFEFDPQTALTLVERGGIAADTGDWTMAARTADEAMALVGDGTYDEYWSSVVVFVWAARVAAHRRDVPGAEALFGTGHSTSAAPHLRASGGIGAHLSRWRPTSPSATPRGRGVIRHARDILQRRPDLGELARTSRPCKRYPRGSSLTAAELPVVPLLSSHLTLQEVADRLFLSRHTVKTHSISIYRKLGVSSRRAAIGGLQEMGLLVT